MTRYSSHRARLALNAQRLRGLDLDLARLAGR